MVIWWYRMAILCRQVLWWFWCGDKSHGYTTERLSWYIQIRLVQPPPHFFLFPYQLNKLARDPHDIMEVSWGGHIILLGLGLAPHDPLTSEVQTPLSQFVHKVGWNKSFDCWVYMVHRSIVGWVKPHQFVTGWHHTLHEMLWMLLMLCIGQNSKIKNVPQILISANTYLQLHDNPVFNIDGKLRFPTTFPTIPLMQALSWSAAKLSIISWCHCAMTCTCSLGRPPSRKWYPLVFQLACHNAIHGPCFKWSTCDTSYSKMRDFP